MILERQAKWIIIIFFLLVVTSCGGPENAPRQQCKTIEDVVSVIGDGYIFPSLENYPDTEHFDAKYYYTVDVHLPLKKRKQFPTGYEIELTDRGEQSWYSTARIRGVHDAVEKESSDHYASVNYHIHTNGTIINQQGIIKYYSYSYDKQQLTGFYFYTCYNGIRYSLDLKDLKPTIPTEEEVVNTALTFFNDLLKGIRKEE